MSCETEYSETVLQIWRTVSKHLIPQLILYEKSIAEWGVFETVLRMQRTVLEHPILQLILYEK